MPAEYGKLTIQELMDLYEGYKWREERDELHRAEMARWIMSAQSKKPIDPYKAIEKRKNKSGQKEAITKEEKEQFFQEHDKVFPKVVQLSAYQNG